MNLEKPGEGGDPNDPNYCFKVSSANRIFDFRAAEAPCFTTMTMAVPLRRIELNDLILSAVQSFALGISPASTCMKFENCWFDDGGGCFVDLIDDRQSRLGALISPSNTPFQEDNLQQRIQGNVVEHLGVTCLG